MKKDKYFKYIVDDLISKTSVFPVAEEHRELYRITKKYDHIFDIEGIGNGFPYFPWPFETIQHLWWADIIVNKLGEKYGLHPHEVKKVYNVFIKEIMGNG